MNKKEFMKENKWKENIRKVFFEVIRVLFLIFWYKFKIIISLFLYGLKVCLL